jgi:aconitate hydratase
MFAENYARVFQGDEHWRSLPVPQGALYQWEDRSTYVHEPPFFQHLDTAPAPIG